MIMMSDSNSHTYKTCWCTLTIVYTVMYFFPKVVATFISLMNYKISHISTCLYQYALDIAHVLNIFDITLCILTQSDVIVKRRRMKKYTKIIQLKRVELSCKCGAFSDVLFFFNDLINIRFK